MLHIIVIEENGKIPELGDLNWPLMLALSPWLFRFAEPSGVEEAIMEQDELSMIANFGI